MEPSFGKGMVHTPFILCACNIKSCFISRHDISYVTQFYLLSPKNLLAILGSPSYMITIVMVYHWRSCAHSERWTAV